MFGTHLACARICCCMTLEGKVCAWVDVSDTLHPESAAAIGVDLSRLLWRALRAWCTRH